MTCSHHAHARLLMPHPLTHARSTTSVRTRARVSPSPYWWQDCNAAPRCDDVSPPVCRHCSDIFPPPTPNVTEDVPPPAPNATVEEEVSTETEATAALPMPASDTSTDAIEDPNSTAPIIVVPLDLPDCGTAQQDIAFYFRPSAGAGDSGENATAVSKQAGTDQSTLDLMVSSRVAIGALSGALDDCSGNPLATVGADGGVLGEAGFVWQAVDSSNGLFAFVNAEGASVPPNTVPAPDAAPGTGDAQSTASSENGGDPSAPIKEVSAATQLAAAKQADANVYETVVFGNRTFHLFSRLHFDLPTRAACAQEPMGVAVFAHSALSGAIVSTQCTPGEPEQFGPAGNASNALAEEEVNGEAAAIAAAKSP